MKSIFTLLLLLACCFALTAQKDDAGFVSIFNGTSLEGWKSNEETPGCYSVEDGVLVVKGGRAHIFYAGEVGGANFKNFELKLKLRTTPGANAGVYFHTEYQEKGWPDKGFEAQVNSTHTDPRKTGSLYGIVNVWVPGSDEAPFGVRVSKKQEVFLYRKEAPSKDNEWADYHIIVQDNHVVIKVNGVTTVDWTQPDDWTRKGRQIDSGTFALQAHDPKSESHFKDIAVKILE